MYLRFHNSVCLLALPLILNLMNTAFAKENLAAAPSVQDRQAGFAIVCEGKPSSTIVLPDKAIPVEVYAADELAKHIQLSTGVKVPIMREGLLDADTQSRIYIGDVRALHQIEIAPNAQKRSAAATVPESHAMPTSVKYLQSLDPNTFLVRTNGNVLFLAGRDDEGDPLQDDVNAGTLFAVYEWLDQQVGVRWLWPGEVGTYVPRQTSLFAGVWTLLSKPRFVHSRLRSAPEFGNFKPASASVREHFVRETLAWKRRHRFARGVSFEYPHAFEDYWDRFGKTHPEYFALRPDGRRGPAEDTPRGHQLVQMCVSNPGLHRQIIADWLERRKAHPDLPWINGAENDQDLDNPTCTCAVCRSWDVPGSKTFADRYARFWMALQAEARKHDPNATVIGYAYSGYTEPTVREKLNDHIIVGIVPAYEFPLGAEQKQTFIKLWSGWAATGAQLYLRPNYFLEGYCMPYIFAAEFGEEFQFAWRNRMIVTDFDSLTGMWGAQSPNLYLLGRIHTRLDLPVASILDEFYAAFGPAAKDFRTYFDYWKTITDRKTAEFNQRAAGGGWSKMSFAGDEIYTPDTFVTGQTLLVKAERAAFGDADALARVRFLSVWLEHARLSVGTLAAFHAYKKEETNGPLKAAFETSRDRLDRFREEHQNNELANANLAFLKQIEVWSGWRQAPQ